MIRNLIFDFGGVLVDWNPRYLYASYFQSKEEMELFLRRVGFDQWNAELDGGYPLNQGVTELCRKFPEYDEPIRLFRDEWEKTVKGPMPGMSGLLDRLKANGYKLYGLTNWSNETFPIARRKYPLFERLGSRKNMQTRSPHLPHSARPLSTFRCGNVIHRRYASQYRCGPQNRIFRYPFFRIRCTAKRVGTVSNKALIPHTFSRFFCSFLSPRDYSSLNPSSLHFLQ